MKIEEKHKILKDWMIKKYNQPKNWDNGVWLYYAGTRNHLRLIPSMFIKWQELLKKGYSENQLIDYFIEIIKYELPELKETKLYFYLDTNDNLTYKII